MSKKANKTNYKLGCISLFISTILVGCPLAKQGADLGSKFFNDYCDQNPNCEDAGDLAHAFLLGFGWSGLFFIIGTIVGTFLIMWTIRKIISIIHWWFDEEY